MVNVTVLTFLFKFLKPGVPTRSVICKFAYFCSLGDSRISAGSTTLDRQAGKGHQETPESMLFPIAFQYPLHYVHIIQETQLHFK